jgi:hypothetical protein
MNLRRGFFRLWIVATILWIAVVTWILWDRFFDPWEDFPATAPSVQETLKYERLHAAALIVMPPISLFVFGLVGLWVVRGFSRRS